MKLMRKSDKQVFEGLGVPADRTTPIVPTCLIGQIEAVDDETAALWVFTDDGRELAVAGDCIVHNGVKIVAVLRAADGEPKGWAPVKDKPAAG